MSVSEQTGMPTDLSAKLVTSGGGKYGDVFTPQGSLTLKMQNKLVSDYGMSSNDASKVTAYNLQNYKPIGKLISDIMVFVQEIKHYVLQIQIQEVI